MGRFQYQHHKHEYALEIWWRAEKASKASEKKDKHGLASASLKKKKHKIEKDGDEF